MAFPITVLDNHVEIYVGGNWVDITSDVLGEGSSSSIDIHRGRDDGLSNVQYGTATMELRNTLGKYSPRNPGSIYYGLLGTNTPLRIYVTPHWTTGTGIDDADNFNRSVVDGWGSTSGAASAYALSGYGGSILTSDWQVNGTYGIQYVPAALGYRASDLTNLNLLDVDVTATVDTFISSVAGGNIELGGIFLRHNSDGRGYLARLDIDASEVMKATLYYGDSIMLAQATVSTFAWTGQSVKVRARIIGNEFSYKVWDASTAEPTAWSVTVEDTQFVEPGSVMIRSGIGVGNTNSKPIEFRWDDISITHIVTRFIGEVPEWPITWDITGSDVRSKISAYGVLCRYNQGTKTARSALERLIRSYGPVMYLPMTDGTDAAVGGGASVSGGTGYYSALTTAPITLSRVEGPVGARDALPEVASTMTTYEPIITVTPSADTGISWQIDFIAKIDRQSTATGTTYKFTWHTEHMRWSIELQWDNTPQYFIILTGSANDASGANVYIQEPFLASDGIWHHYGIRVFDNSGTINTSIFTDGSTFYSLVGSAGMAGRITNVTIWGIPDTEASSTSIGHIALYAIAPTYSTYPAMDGYIDESISTRCARLSAQDNVNLVVQDDGTSARLTGQRKATLVELLQDMQSADLGVMYESRGSRTLTYRALNALQGQTQVELNYTDHEPTGDAGFLPIDDDQALWNDVTVERYNASSYRTERTTGVNNTAEPPNGIGTYDRGKYITHVASDADLPNVANWLLLLGTWDEFRWPTIPVNLARSPFTSDHQLSNDIAYLDIGDALSVINLPVWVPPMPVHAIVQGYSEHLSNFEWSIAFITTPAGPYEIAQVAGIPRVCADSDMTLAIAVDANDTALHVFSTSGDQRWCHADDDAESASDYPMNVLVGGELVSATDCNYPVRDGFDRTHASSWESTDTGEAWNTTGSNATYSTATPYGSIAPIALATDCRCIVLHGGSNHEVRVQTKLPSLAAFTVSMRAGLMVRCTDANNFYTGYLLISATGGIQVIAVKRVAGTATQLGASVTINRTYVANELWYVQMRVAGSTVSVKAWPVAGIEPGWQIVHTDTALATGTYVGCLARNNGAAAGAQVDFTEFRVVSPQELTVVRTARGVAHAVGAVIDVAEQAHVGL